VSVTTPPTSATSLRARIAGELGAARGRTLALLAPLDDATLRAQHSPLMSPLVWDLAHVANYEDQWLLRALGADGLGVGRDETYDAFRHPRADRPQLDLLTPDEARGYGAAVRERAMALLEHGDLAGDDPLLRDGFVYGMVAQHEQQHIETMLATISLIEGGYVPHVQAIGPVNVAASRLMRDEVLVPEGAFVMGTDDDPWALDNERPAHVVDLAPYWIDTAPVANGAYAAFIADGGYDDARLWHRDGWAWRATGAVTHPLHWVRDGEGGWLRDRFGLVEPLRADEPVQHVCWYEADAFARWAGKRLPTEAEWEKAATWDPATSTKRRQPWGGGDPDPARANLTSPDFAPHLVGGGADGASAYGCVQLIGDVWEWTASDFAAYPGFEPFPYREYSEVFFGPEHKVLRGGSWATAPVAIRGTFRNWDLPIRRQIFAGFRCARDAGNG
jgi:iron(II)-dependent oxidoreductase